MTSRRFTVRCALMIVATISMLCVQTAAQAPGTATTTVPIPGSGHNYIHALSETVDPASGSVSLRIAVPIPKGRGLTLPFNFAYDTNGIYYPSTGSWSHFHTGLMSTGGWSYTVPAIAADEFSYPVGSTNVTCYYNTNYRFTDPTGGRKGLGLLLMITTSPDCQGHNQLSGSDMDFAAEYVAGTGYKVADTDGTVYAFGGLDSLGPYGNVVPLIEDRNGNQISISSNATTGAFTETDTLGRAVLSSSGFGSTGNTLAVSGVGTYTLTWESAAYNFTVDTNNVYNGSTYACTFAGGSNGGSAAVVKAIQLPNGKSYNFKFGTDDSSNSNPYGLISQITYPDGGWIKYSWSTNAAAAGGVFPNLQGQVGQCDWRWGKPVLSSRQISFDGLHVAQKQTYQYTTSWGPTGTGNSYLWSSKQTTVTTQDLIRGTSFTTTYLYSPNSISTEPVPQYIGAQWTVDPQIPVEQTVTYKDVGGTTDKVVNKTWFNGAQLQTEKDTLGSQTSQKTYTYSGNQLIELDEIDFGQSAPSRKTINTYQAFAAAPTYPSSRILDRPCKTVVYDGSSNRYSETDYFYDNGATTTPCAAAGTPSVQTAGGSTLTGHDETNYGTSSTAFPRGNLTQKTQWLSSGSPVTTYTYDETGQVLSITDPCGNPSCSDMTGTPTTNYFYTDSFVDTNSTGYSTTAGTPPSGKVTNAYLTKVTQPIANGIAHVTNYSYGYNNGELTQSIDQQNTPQTTTYRYNDSLSRITESDYPDTGETLLAYSDSAPSPSVTTQRLISSGTYLTSVATMDGLGHVVKTTLTDPDCATGDTTATTYDGMGRVYTVSNPYCTTSDPTYGLTTYTYDALGRSTKVSHPDGTSTTTSYTGRATDVLDEGNGTRNIERISQTDGLGRLVSVCEVTSTSQLGPGGTPAACGQDISKTGFLTSYTYDVLNNLLSVSQGSLNRRTFAYDSLSRLLCAANPETGASATCPNPDNGTYTAGTTRYAYDANGNVISRVRPAPNQTSASNTVTTSYQFDALNRLTQEGYSDGVTSPALFGYDQTNITMGTQQFTISNSIGRLSWTCVQVGSSCPSMTANSYDSMGRIAELWQRNPVGSNNIWISYLYDSLGDETNRSLSGTTDAATFNGAGRLLTFTATNYTDATNPANLLASGHYDAFGHLTSATLANGLTESWGYDKRERLQAMAVGTTCSGGVCTGSSVYNYTVGYASNSDVLSVTDKANGTWSYSYDDFNRLISGASSAGPCAGMNLAWSYDRYGNRWNQTASGSTSCTALQPSASFTGNNNRIDTYSYDAAGNLLNDGSNAYQYDAESRIISVNNGATTYTYNANGQRVSKTTGGTTTDLVYDREGHITLYNSSAAAPSSPFVEAYVGGFHLGTYVLNSTKTDTIFYYDHADWLGTERARTNLAGSACETIQSLPFGDGQAIAGTCGDISPMHFTGKERDTESGLDNLGARYYASGMGRFMTPDWAARPTMVPYAVFGDPQSLNLYTYVRNDPVTRADADGHGGKECHLDQTGNGRGRVCTTIGNKPGGPIDGPEDDSYFWNGSAQAKYAAWYKQKYGHLPPTGECPTSTCHTFNGTNPPLPQARISPLNLLATILAGAAGVTVSSAESTAMTEGTIYRSGGSNPGNLKIRPGEDAVSFRDSLSNPIDAGGRPVFKPGSDFIQVDVSKLPPGSAVLDNSPAGHVSVTASPDEIKSAIVLKDTLPE